MTLKAQMSADMVALTSTNEFGEAITYYAGGTGTGRVVNAVVERQEPRPRPEDGNVTALGAILHVRNHATLGIAAHTPADTALVVLRVGQPAELCRVIRVLLADEGAWVLEVVR
jgi:hypothetical protein